MTRELISAVLESVTRDDDVGNTVLAVLVETDTYLGFEVERIVLPATIDGPLLVHASRRALAAAALERLERESV